MPDLELLLQYRTQRHVVPERGLEVVHERRQPGVLALHGVRRDRLHQRLERCGVLGSSPDLEIHLKGH